eukprot:1184328-Prymnesium_polylepis.3
MQDACTAHLGTKRPSGHLTLAPCGSASKACSIARSIACSWTCKIDERRDKMNRETETCEGED